MADLTITAANVLASANARRKHGTAGVNLTAGQALYADATDGKKLKLADANLSDAAAEVVGIAAHGTLAGQPIEYIEFDPDFTPGATLVSGTTYILSGTAGGICPDSDAVSTWRKRILFAATSTTKANMQLVKGGTI